MKNFKFGLAALLAISSLSYADDSFSWNTYMRAGTGLSLDSSVQKDKQKTASAYGASYNGTEATNTQELGRFGNEYDMWITSTMSKKVTSKNGSWAETKLSLSISSGDPEVSSIANGTGYTYLDEASVKMGGLDFLPNGATLKVGKFGLSEDIHALDYKFKSVGGTGIAYKKDKLQLGFFVNESNGTGTKAIDFENSYGNFDTKVTLTQNLANDDSSISGLVAYNQKKLLGILPGTTKYIAELGKGVGMRADGIIYLSRNTYISDKDDTAWRFIVDGHSDLGKWVVNPVVWAESYNPNASNKSTFTRLIAGGRVTQKLTNNLEMIYEGFVANDQNRLCVATADGTQYKISAGPSIQLDMGEWVRPVIRLSLTEIGGDKKVTGLKKDSELRAGVQFETWF